jgi:hypothetical protein
MGKQQNRHKDGRYCTWQVQNVPGQEPYLKSGGINKTVCRIPVHSSRTLLPMFKMFLEASSCKPSTSQAATFSALLPWRRGDSTGNTETQTCNTGKSVQQNLFSNSLYEAASLSCCGYNVRIPTVLISCDLSGTARH